ncbi:c-type cytochrome [Castellaniella hirudinis]|uniref:C-type cytochrome n=1 Tax=Castellaniella hirudinis TaxID=1144617 RepID=A0ABV8RUB0_9BURK
MRGKAIRIMRAAVLTLGAVGAASAQTTGGAAVDGLALASQRQCLGCHQVDARRVGPPFRAIAERFQGRPEAADHLARMMREGSRGQWGAIPMPAQTRLSDIDARRLALWILSLKDAAAD